MTFCFDKWIDLRIRDHIILLVVLVIGLLPPASHVRAQSTITIPKSTVDSTLFKTQWVKTYAGQKQTEELVMLYFLIELYKQNPGMDSQAATNEMQKLREAYEQKVIRGQSDQYVSLKSKHEILLELLDAASSLAGPLAPLSKFVYKQVQDYGFKEWDSVNQLLATNAQYENYEKTHAQRDEILQEAREIAQVDPNFAKAFDMQHAPNLNASIKDSASQLIQNNPDLLSQQGLGAINIRIKFEPDGSVVTSLDELKQMTQEQLGLINSVVVESLDRLKKIDAQQTKLLKYAEDAEMRRIEAEAAERDSQMHQLKISAASSGIFLLSTFVGFADPKLGQDISVVGNSAIQIAESITKYVDTASKLGEIGEVLGSVIMTGNIVGALLNITSLFGGGPSPEQMILEELRELRKQVSQLRTEMHDRFDRIDHALNDIFDTMNYRFNQIDMTLGRIEGDIRQIQQELVRIESQLSHLEANTFKFFMASEQHDLLFELDKVVDYKDRTGLDLSYESYNNSERLFHAYATVFAFNQVAPVQNYDDKNVLEQLTKYPLDANLNYLNGWLVAHNIPPFTNNPLPNLRVWDMASRGYSEIAFDWPEHACRIPPAENRAIVNKGIEIRAALKKISTLEGATPLGNHQLFDELTKYYNNKSTVLDQAIQSTERAYLERKKVELQRGTDIDFWGGPDQQTSFTPDTLSVMKTCGSGEGELMAPIGLQALIPRPYLLADYLNPGNEKLNICYLAEWVNEKVTIDQGIDMDRGVWRGNLRISVNVLYEEKVIYTRHRDGGFEKIGLCCPYMKKPIKTIQERWDNSLKVLFEDDLSKHPQSDSLPPEIQQLYSTVFTEVDKQLKDYQNDIYREIYNKLEHDDLRPPNEELGGAKLLLHDFITLGFPTAFKTDDYLRSFFEGNQQLFQNQLVIDTYSNATAQPDNQNIRIILKTRMDERSSALYNLLQNYLNLIDQSKWDEAQAKAETVCNTFEVFCGASSQSPFGDPMLAQITQFALPFSKGKWDESDSMIETALLRMKVSDNLARMSSCAR